MSTEGKITYLPSQITVARDLTARPTYAMMTAIVMSLRAKLPPLLGALLLFNSFALSEEKPWREVRSPHFRVITNGSEKGARHVAGAFEQMRGLFAAQFPGFRVDSPAPLLILAPEDEFTTKKLVPEYWQHGGPKPAGVYFHGWETQFALVRLDEIDSDHDAFAVVYHEYVHNLLHLNFRWLPTWLDEGLANFYCFTRFEKNQTYIGAPPRNIGWMEVLRRRVSIPLDKFLEQRNSFTHSEDDTYLYYAQAWALTHFLTFAPGMERGSRLKKFFNSLQAGAEQKKAFQDAFGDMSRVQKDLDDYVHLFAFQAGVIPSLPLADEKSFSSRTMTVPETGAELATFFIATGHWKEARASVEAAVAGDPKLALAHQDLGFLDLHDGKDEDAVREFSQALELDSHLYRALFARTMLSSLPHATSADDRESFHSSLIKVLEGNPEFAPAFVELAKFFVAQGDLNRALAMARTAEKVEPHRAGYHLLTGQLLLRMGRNADAAAHAAYVASRWGSPDHDEAMELWNRVPPAQRPAESPSDIIAADLQSAEGTVKSVSCEPNLFTLTLDRAGQSMVFKIKGAPGGFSDTLWFGGNFTPCFHVTGLRAVVRYKSGADKSSIGDVVSWGFRDDLPATRTSGQEASTHN
jgi:tetratricopeptide (TPR) repeat protein